MTRKNWLLHLTVSSLCCMKKVRNVLNNAFLLGYLVSRHFTMPEDPYTYTLVSRNYHCCPRTWLNTQPRRHSGMLVSNMVSYVGESCPYSYEENHASLLPASHDKKCVKMTSLASVPYLTEIFQSNPFPFPHSPSKVSPDAIILPYFRPLSKTLAQFPPLPVSVRLVLLIFCNFLFS